MTRELILLRYSLLIIPAILSIQVYEFADYDWFTLHFMLLMLLVTLGARTSGSPAALTGGMELVLTAWLCYEYGPLMVFRPCLRCSPIPGGSPRIRPLPSSVFIWPC